MGFPKTKELAKFRKKLDKADGTLLISPDASTLEKFRYEICRQFVIYQREHNLKSKDLAKLVNIDESLMSKVLRYRHQRFSTDRLIEMLAKIYPKHRLILKVS